MPLYETVMQEKPPVVLDLGTAYTKLGFAAEAHPRKIIPSEVLMPHNGVTKSIFDYSDEMDFNDQLVEFFQMVFFKHLLVSPKERKIVIVENVFGKTMVRETLARVLFLHFEVSSIMFVPLHMIALSALAIPTAIVVDMGYSETTVMPVFEGVQILQGFRDQQYGGRLIHTEIKRQLMENGVDEKHLPEYVLEDIKVRTCIITTLERAQAYRSNDASEAAPPDVDYPITDEDIITIPGRLRETGFEIIFEDNNERDSLPHLIMQAILQCPVDVRKSLVENVFVIGGSAIIMGLLPRLKQELQYLAENDLVYKEKLPSNVQFKFHKTIGRENFTGWLGGSLCGGTDLIQSRSISKDSYIKHRRIPDWICLADNRPSTV